MDSKNKNYFFLVAIHVLIGFIIYLLPIISVIYTYLILVLGFCLVAKTQNKNNEVLYVAGYLVGAEVFIRMTGGSTSYEFGKYGVAFFSLLGMYYSGLSKNTTPYWIYLLLLLPSIFLAGFVLNSDINPRKLIIFNISGPISLGIASIYTYRRKITNLEVNNILLMIGLPIVSCATYVFFFAPKIKDVLQSTGSNNALAGGFGANQVSTIFGLGMFIFVTRLFLDSKTKFMLLLNLIIAAYISYRGLLTFSRGGMITGLAMIILVLAYIYLISKSKIKSKLNYLFLLLFIISSFVWSFLSFKTDGLIDKRYANQDARGVTKADKFTGRGELAEQEINMFYDNPLLGVGVGKGTEIRQEIYGTNTASHDEITRTLAEHGTFGLVAFVILLITPFALFYKNYNHIYMFAFFFFWLLTINHAAMRTASPGFIYALALLKINIPDD